MDKYEIRRLALVDLRANIGHGAVTKIAAAIGKDPNYVSRMMYPHGKKGRKRIGEDSVELLNQAFPSWLDSESNEPSRATFQNVRADLTTFQLLDARAACGSGAINSDYPEIVTSIAMPIGEAIRLIGASNRNGSIRIIVAAKDSMVPTIMPNDLLFVDTSINEYIGENVYVLVHGGELVCKRLTLVGKSLMVVSDNVSYPAWEWSERPESTRIVGRVLKALPMTFKNFVQG